MYNKITINDYINGDSLHENNLDEVFKLVQEIRISFPEKTIWLYTGFRWDLLMTKVNQSIFHDKDFEHFIDIHKKRRKIISMCNVVVDGEYIDEQKDLTLKWKGSKNQRVIDVKQSLSQNEVVLYCK